ncbi:MAG: hypothetical protein ACD_23C01400G0002 [uncultured bacterium]|nr:MAG: hypothetical protein ACD_23C01400G0002 [uncultured bacterium]
MMRRGRLGMSTLVLIFHFSHNTKRGLSPIVPRLAEVKVSSGCNELAEADKTGVLARRA